MDQLDKRIIAALQDDLPLVPEPYKAIAEKIGVTETELLERLAIYQQTGVIRKMGAVLKHREVGFTANALCAWNIPPAQLDRVGQLMAARPVVTHCYARISQQDWPYNFYTMLHAHSREECEAIAADLAAAAEVGDYIMLFSTKEWKKSSMRYFEEGGRNV